MRLVVSDTSPLNYLVLIGAQDVLKGLYGEVIVPSQVIEELQHERAPEPVRQWVGQLPAWLRIETGDATRFPTLDPGESAALWMAMELESPLLVDEAAARSVASRLGVSVTGTIGVLVEAHVGGLIEFEAAITSLLKTSFRVQAKVIENARRALRG